MGRINRWARIAAGVTGRGPGRRRLRRAVAERIVLVTGASEGIGAASARQLAAAGATVLLVARNESRLRQVRDEIVAAGGQAYVHPADLSAPPVAAALAEDLLRRYRRIDVVVSNAGRSIRRSVADTVDRFHDVERTTSLNYLGPVQLLLVVLAAMRTAGGGHVVNVSTAGLSGPAPHFSAYLASKAAFDVWLRSAAAELRADGITVSTVYCGLARTRMSAPTRIYRRMPAMTPEEAAGVVCRAVSYPHSWWPWWARVGAVITAALPGAVRSAQSAALRAVRAAEPLRALRKAGLLRPGRLLAIARASRRYGATLAAALVVRPPDDLALVDTHGPVRYRELDTAAGECARAAHHVLGVREGDRVGVACADGRGLVAAVAGLARLGADAVLIPPDLPQGRLARMIGQERITAVVHDDGEAGRFDGLVPALAWTATLEVSAPPPPRPRRWGRVIVLTSGTTGVPRGTAPSLSPRTLAGPASTHLDLIPLRAGEPIVVAAPSHHGYGLAYLAAGLALGAPVVLAGGADPRGILAAVAEHRQAAWPNDGRMTQPGDGRAWSCLNRTDLSPRMSRPPECRRTPGSAVPAGCPGHSSAGSRGSAAPAGAARRYRRFARIRCLQRGA